RSVCPRGRDRWRSHKPVPQPGQGIQGTRPCGLDRVVAQPQVRLRGVPRLVSPRASRPARRDRQPLLDKCRAGCEPNLGGWGSGFGLRPPETKNSVGGRSVLRGPEARGPQARSALAHIVVKLNVAGAASGLLARSVIAVESVTV